MSKKFINKDPLAKNSTLGSADYQTGTYPQAMYLPEEDETLFLLKEFRHSELLVSADVLFQFAQNNKRNWDFKTEAIVLSELLKANRSIIDWEEVVLETLFRNQRKDSQRTRETIRRELVNSMLEWHKPPINELDEMVEILKNCLVEKLIEKGRLALYDMSSGEYISAIFYFGDGKQSSAQNGKGGISWTHRNEVIYFKTTWVS